MSASVDGAFFSHFTDQIMREAGTFFSGRLGTSDVSFGFDGIMAWLHSRLKEKQLFLRLRIYKTQSSISGPSRPPYSTSASTPSQP